MSEPKIEATPVDPQPWERAFVDTGGFLIMALTDMARALPPSAQRAFFASVNRRARRSPKAHKETEAFLFRSLARQLKAQQEPDTLAPAA